MKGNSVFVAVGGVSAIPRSILRVLCVLLFAACASLFATGALAQIPATERQVLMDLYNGTKGDGWRNNSGWKTAGDFSPVGTECDWKGVSCDAGKNTCHKD